MSLLSSRLQRNGREKNEGRVPSCMRRTDKLKSTDEEYRQEQHSTEHTHTQREKINGIILYAHFTVHVYLFKSTALSAFVQLSARTHRRHKKTDQRTPENGTRVCAVRSENAGLSHGKSKEYSIMQNGRKNKKWNQPTNHCSTFTVRCVYGAVVNFVATVQNEFCEFKLHGRKREEERLLCSFSYNKRHKHELRAL